jgi:hypothetical protein
VAKGRQGLAKVSLAGAQKFGGFDKIYKNEINLQK